MNRLIQIFTALSIGFSAGLCAFENTHTRYAESSVIPQNTDGTFPEELDLHVLLLAFSSFISKLFCQKSDKSTAKT